MNKIEKKAFRNAIAGAMATFTICLGIFLYGLSAMGGKLQTAQKEIDLLNTQRWQLNHRMIKAEQRAREIPFFKFLDETMMTRDPNFIEATRTVWKHKGEINPFLIMAVISRESDFDPKAQSFSATGKPIAYGLMQINFDVWKSELQLDRNKIFEIPYNIEHGIQILQRYLDKHPGDISRALWGYYGGTDGPYTYPDRVLNSRYFR